MIYQFDIEQIQNYMSGLCTRHMELKHDVDGIKSYARFQSDEEMTALRNNAGKNIVVVASVTGRRVGHKDDKTLQREITLRIASYAENSSSDAIQLAVKTAEHIMLDFITEMERQQDADNDRDVCGILKFLRPELITWEPVEDQPWLINHYGWDVTFPFKVFMPKHDPTKWTV